MTRALVLLALTALVSLVLTGTAAARTYYAKVGPGMTITVKNASGVKVSRIPRGTHTIRVRDTSVFHNFHLIGPPDVNRRTTVPFTGLRIWTIRFVPGVYRYRCDPHRLHMRGSFTVV